MRIYLSTGEASGDAHGAAVARALRRRHPGVSVEATGGRELAAAGAVLRHGIEQCGVVGGAEVFRALPAHLRLLADLKRRLKSGEYDLAILVDYPGFHLRLARIAAAAGVPVLYYIAPQLWAWGSHRAGTLRQAARAVAVILPFEEPFLRARGVPATFVGHPLLDRPSLPTRTDARRALGVPEASPVLGIFPGSRALEVERLWPPFREAATLARRAVPDVSLVVAAIPGARYPGSEGFVVHRADPRAVFAAADAGLCKSGTTTLEAALADLPMVIAYRMHPWSWALARRLVTVRHVGLVNLVAGREVAPELIQDRATPRALADAVLPLLDSAGRAARGQRSGFAEVRERLGQRGAGERVAELAAALVA